MKLGEEHYLGDAYYAEWDGMHVKLIKGHGGKGRKGRVTMHLNELVLASLIELIVPFIKYERKPDGEGQETGDG
jgi:hypothetical protein